MRKIMRFLVGILLIMFLCSCDKQFPKIEYRHRPSKSTNDEKIIINDGYMLNQSHPYDVTDTESGYAITLYFVKEKTEEDNE